MSSAVRITTGQSSFDYGVDSSRVPLVQSTYNPNGLPRNATSWAVNVNHRSGGLQQRFGYKALCKVHDGTALYQGGILYDASSGYPTVSYPSGNPYLLLSIGGRTYQVRVDTDNSVHDVTGAFADPPTVPKCYWAQGEQFAIKQVGDGVTLPLFWDGLGLRRSNGVISPNNIPGGASPLNELPAATAMVYYMGRLWYAQNRKVIAGDIVGNQSSGGSTYNFTNSILRVTENPLAIGGDGFSVPSSAGNIRALNYPISLDTQLGQGPLFVFTPKQIYSLTVPVTRADWIASGNTNQPLMSVVMRSNGTVSDRSIVAINGDLFFQSLDPAIRSYLMAIRYFGSSWANPPISNNINRIMSANDRSLMHFASGFEFGERVYQAVLPIQTPVGVAFTALAVLDTDPVSTLQNPKQPIWDGAASGLDILQAFSGDFGGLERAFAVVHNRIDGSIWVWEITSGDQFDTNPSLNEVRVPMLIETPAFDWSEYPRDKGGGVFETKRLDGLDLWVDRVFGEVIIKVEFRPDETTCWYEWGTTKICSARNCAENINTPTCYPITPDSEDYRNPISFPTPTNTDCQPGNNRPVTIGYKFQLRITTQGWVRIRGYQLHAIKFETAPFASSICGEGGSWMSTPPPTTFPQPLPPPQPPTPPETGQVFGNPQTGEIFGTPGTGEQFGFGF